MKRVVTTLAVGTLIAAGVFLTAVGGAPIAAGAPTELPQVTIAMDGSSITVGGTLQSGAVDIVMNVTNESSGEALLVRLNPGVTPDELYQFLASPAAGDPNNVGDLGAIAFDGGSVAQDSSSDVDTTLEAAEYAALDENGNDPSTFPHTAFTVAQASQPATLPTPDATVKAIDFGFRGARSIGRGQIVRFENDGWVVHMIAALRVKNGSDARELVAALRTGDDRTARHLVTGFVSFLAPVSHGTVEQFAVHAKPGIYVLACFMDTQDGREHTLLGMERVFHVTR